MEVKVHVFHAGITDATRFNLHCRAQAVGSENCREIHEGSVAITTQPASSTSTLSFAFTFASKPAKIALLFVAKASRKESTSSTEKELGRCEGTIDTGSTLQHSQTLLFSQHIPGTKIEKFTGKLKYAVCHTSVSGADYLSLLKDEAKRMCVSVLPSESPFVSVVFHYAYTTNDPNQQLVGVARIGDRSDIRVDTLLQKGKHSSEQFHHIPFLKPVKVFCQEFDCLELHVVDNKNGTILFSLSRALNRLVPLKPIHYNYDRKCFLNAAEGGVHTVGTDDKAPSISVSVTYTPSHSEFSRFEGFEVVVCEISIPHTMQHYKDVVLGIQLVPKQSKMKTPSLGGLKPPFQPQSKKGKTAPSMEQDYHVTVLQCQGKDLTTAIKSYLLFSCSPKKFGDSYLVFHVFGSSGTHLWWNTDNFLSAQLEISEETLTQLQSREIPSIPWKAGHDNPSQVYISGIMRWKSKQMPFITESDLKHVQGSLQPKIPQQTSFSLNKTDSRLSTKTDLSFQQETFDPASIQQTLEGLVTPSSEAEHRDPDILTQLAEFESTLQLIARDFRILRKENQRLQGDNEELLLQMDKLKALVTVSPHKQSALHLLSTSDLILRIGSLEQSLEAKERAHEMCQKKIQSMQNELSSKQDMETRYMELQEAHMAQQKLVKLLRDKVTKYYKCSDVCRKQEQVITQLESLLAKQTEVHPPTKDDAISLLTKENAQLRVLLLQYHTSSDRGQQEAALTDKDHTIHSLKSQLSQVVNRCQYLETHATRSDDKQEFDTRLFELEQKLLVAEAKLSAQSSQLQKNAEQWMAEKAHYELQLAGFRSRLDTVIRSGQQALSTTQATPGASHESESETHQEGSHMRRYFSRKTNTKDFSF